jgi:hypothetical protein
MHGSICNKWSQFEFLKSQAACEEFLRGLPTKGTYTLLMDHLFSARKFLSDSVTLSVKTITNSAEWVSQRQLLHFILSVQLQNYNEFFLGLISGLADSTLQIKVAIMLGYVFGVIFSFIALWLPYLLQLRTEIWRTDAMLIIIPNDVICSNKFLKELFLKKNTIFNQISDDTSNAD